MSKRDRELLDAAGLSIGDAETFFQRSKPALYQALSQQSRDAFSAKDAMALLHNAKRTDSPNIDHLAKFIERNFPTESELILLDRISCEQVNHAVVDADAIVIVFNGNAVDHLAPTASFAKVLAQLLQPGHVTLGIVAPGDWVGGYIAQNLGLNNLPQITPRAEVAHIPTFLMISKQGSFRAFVFTRTSIEELPQIDAENLWRHYEPMSVGSSAHKSRGAA